MRSTTFLHLILLMVGTFFSLSAQTGITSKQVSSVPEIIPTNSLEATDPHGLYRLEFKGSDASFRFKRGYHSEWTVDTEHGHKFTYFKNPEHDTVHVYWRKKPSRAWQQIKLANEKKWWKIVTEEDEMALWRMGFLKDILHKAAWNVYREASGLENDHDKWCKEKMKETFEWPVIKSKPATKYEPNILETIQEEEGGEFHQQQMLRKRALQEYALRRRQFNRRNLR